MAPRRGLAVDEIGYAAWWWRGVADGARGARVVSINGAAGLPKNRLELLLRRNQLRATSHS